LALDLVALQAVEHAQQRTSRHQITLKAQAAPSLVAGDRVRLRQVFDNLLANAVKFAPDGGPITVYLETVDTLPTRSPDLPSWMQADSSDARGEKAGQQRTTSQWVLARVADVGLGIPAEAVPHVFDRYWRAGGATAHIRGTSLGLYACRAIVAAHGGHIWVERSVPAVDGGIADEWHGTVMALLLPLASSHVLGAADNNGAAVMPGATVG
jgi:signal transduction histidine kinase